MAMLLEINDMRLKYNYNKHMSTFRTGDENVTTERQILSLWHRVNCYVVMI